MSSGAGPVPGKQTGRQIICAGEHWGVLGSTLGSITVGEAGLGMGETGLGCSYNKALANALKL